MHRHVYIQKDMHTLIKMHTTHVHSRVYIQAHTHIYMHTHIHTEMHVYTHTNIHTYSPHKHAYKHMYCIHTNTLTQIHTQAYTPTQTHICKLEMERTGNLMLGQIMKSPEIHWARAGIIAFESFCGVGQSQGRVEYLPHFTVNRTKHKMMNLWVIGINHWFHAMCTLDRMRF